MKKIITSLLIFISILSININITEASNIDSKELKTKVEKIFSAFVQRSEKRLTKKGAFNEVSNLEAKLSNVLSKKELKGDKFTVYNTLLESSREYISDYKYYDFQIKKKLELSKYKIIQNFTHKITDKEEVFLENGIWYTYYFTSYLGFPNNVTPNTRDLEYNNILPDKHLAYLSDDGLVFVKDFQKIKLISDDIIVGIPDKAQFLKEVRDDKQHIQIETDQDFVKLKIISKNLTKDLYKTQDKIDVLYNYVLDNVKYTQPINLKDKKIFSGIQTFKNKDGVCEGYVKYFQYLLQFSGVEGVESLRGYVVDAQDYPQIGHAWNKIGDYYYDPTFDDPIGITKTREKSDYYYYKLPKDLFYTNRYDYGVTNSTLEKAPLVYREQYIKKNLVNIFFKYKDSDYNILNELKFRSKYGFDMYDEISIESLKKNYGYTKVNNFTYQENGQTKRIKKYNFFTLSNSNDVRVILKQLKYDLTDYKLFEWTETNGEIYYRLGFNIQIN